MRGAVNTRRPVFFYRFYFHPPFYWLALHFELPKSLFVCFSRWYFNTDKKKAQKTRDSPTSGGSPRSNDERYYAKIPFFCPVSVSIFSLCFISISLCPSLSLSLFPPLVLSLLQLQCCQRPGLDTGWWRGPAFASYIPLVWVLFATNERTVRYWQRNKKRQKKTKKLLSSFFLSLFLSLSALQVLSFSLISRGTMLLLAVLLFLSFFFISLHSTLLRVRAIRLVRFPTFGSEKFNDLKAFCIVLSYDSSWVGCNSSKQKKKSE